MCAASYPRLNHDDDYLMSRHMQELESFENGPVLWLKEIGSFSVLPFL